MTMTTTVMAMVAATNKITYKNGIAMVGCGVKFHRIRRITGYLVGNMDRFCNAKRSEESDRIKHTVH